MPTVLAIDTSTAACSAALWRDGAVAAGRREIIGRGHAENLMPMIDAVMQEAGAVPADLSLIAVTTGPGAFTGLRLGLASARGLALGLDLPCLGLTTTEAMAAAVVGGEAGDEDGAADRAENGEVIIAVLDSKRGDFYLQAFAATGAALGDAVVARPETLAEILAAKPGDARNGVLVGDVQRPAAEILAAAGWRLRQTDVTAPDARVVARLAAARWRPDAPRPPMPAPLYLRPADATPAKRGGRIRE